mgnify:FL=1
MNGINIGLIKELNGEDFDYIAHIRATTPLRDLNALKKSINFFIKTKYDSLRSVHEMTESAFKSFTIKNKMLKTINISKKSIDDVNSPRQLFENTYVANGVIDIYKKNYIKKNNKLFGKKVFAFKTKYHDEIDTIEQFNFIEYLMKKNVKKN